MVGVGAHRRVQSETRVSAQRHGGRVGNAVQTTAGVGSKTEFRPIRLYTSVKGAKGGGALPILT